MKLHYILFILSLSISPIFSQVGINTTNPSPASVLDINSSNDNVNFGGLMPPKVSPAQRDQIPVTAADDGLMVFVIDGDTRELQVFDGLGFYWQTVYRLNNELIGFLSAWEVSEVSDFGPSPFDPVQVHPVVSVGGLTRGSGVSTSGTGASDAWGGSAFDSLNKNAAITGDKFVSFTITPIGSNIVSLSSIEPYTTRRSGTGPITGIWQYSINGVDFTDIGSNLNWGTDPAPGNIITHPKIILSGIGALQNLTSTTTVTLRIVNWEASAAVGNWYISNMSGYDIIIKGN